MVILAVAAILVTMMVQGSNDDTEYVITADEVKKIEDAHYERLAAAGALSGATSKTNQEQHS